MLPLKLTSIVIDLTPADILECEQFAKNYYYGKHKDRGQQDLNLQKEQNKGGKLLEVAVFKYYKNKGFDITYPDFNLYPPNQKGWAPDLFIKGKPTHIKSTNPLTSKIFGESYTFQYADRYGRKDGGDYDRSIFNDLESKDAVICGIIDGMKATLRIRSELWVLHQYGLFKPSTKYPIEKKVVFFSDVEKLINGNL